MLQVDKISDKFDFGDLGINKCFIYRRPDKSTKTIERIRIRQIFLIFQLDRGGLRLTRPTTLLYNWKSSLAYLNGDGTSIYLLLASALLELAELFQEGGSLQGRLSYIAHKWVGPALDGLKVADSLEAQTYFQYCSLG